MEFHYLRTGRVTQATFAPADAAETLAWVRTIGARIAEALARPDDPVAFPPRPSNPRSPSSPASGAAAPRPRDHTVTVSGPRKSQVRRLAAPAFGPGMNLPSVPVRRLGGLGTAALPRLLPLPAAAWYLGISLFSLRDVVKSGGLRPVPVPLPPDRRGRRQDGQLRKLLFDVRDLDQLIEAWKERQRSAAASR